MVGGGSAAFIETIHRRAAFMGNLIEFLKMNEHFTRYFFQIG